MALIGLVLPVVFLLADLAITGALGALLQQG